MECAWRDCSQSLPQTNRPTFMNPPCGIGTQIYAATRLFAVALPTMGEFQQNGLRTASTGE
jgi:hypothetical protein